MKNGTMGRQHGECTKVSSVQLSVLNTTLADEEIFPPLLSIQAQF